MGTTAIKSNSRLFLFPSSHRVFLTTSLFLVSFLCHFNLADAKTTTDAKAKEGLTSNTALNKRELSPKIYCSSSTPCSIRYDGCDLETNTCREYCSGMHEYWNGYVCSYCGYNGDWDYENYRCNIDDNDWVIWTIMGVCLGVGLLICITVVICCVRNSKCPLYRRRLRKQQQQQATAESNIVAQPTMVYGNPGMYPHQQMVYAVPVQGQGQFIQYQQQQQQQPLQQQSASQGAPIELMPINNVVSENPTRNASVASTPVASASPVTSVYPSLNP